MKTIACFLIGMIFAIGIMAQTPHGISHQAVIRDANNDLVVGSEIGIRISILSGGAEGEAIYVETHTPESNSNGLITFVIGTGIVESGNFAEIDWSDGLYFLKTQADPTGGTDYSIIGITQFLSVPYAYFSDASRVAQTFKDGDQPGEMMYWNGEEWLIITPGASGQVLTMCDGVPAWGPCMYTLELNVLPPDGGMVAGAGEYEIGEQFNIVAIANEGWVFVEWTGDTDHIDNLSSATAIVTMPANDIILTANFEEDSPAWPHCPGIPTVTDADGNIYNTVLIGEQCWMRENLKTTKYKNDTPIENITEHSDWADATTGAYAWFVNDIQNKDSYGALYNWYAVTNTNGLCPEGWDVPEDTDWTQLIDYIVETFEDATTLNAGNILKSCRQVNSPLENNCNTEIHPRWNEHETHYGTDLIGFSALPGGNRQTTFFGGLGAQGHWWSKTSANDTNAWMRRISFNESHVDRWEMSKVIGYSVRCIKQ